MRRLLLGTVLSCCMGPTSLLAQREELPIAALVEIDLVNGPSLTARLLAAGADSLVLQAEGAETPGVLRMDAVSKIRVKQSAPVWTATLGENVERFRLVTVPAKDKWSLPERWLLVFGKEAITALDPGTGETVWRVTHVTKPHEAGFVLLDGIGPYAGLMLESEELLCLDLRTGERRWTVDSLPFTDWEGGFYTLDDHVLLLYGKTDASDGSLLAYDTETGEELWRQDSLFVERPRSRWGFQAEWLYRDSTLVLYASKDGPIAIDMMSGALRWRADALEGRDVPDLGAYARMYLDDDLMLTPTEKGILAIDPRSGTALWDSIPRLRSRPLQMSVTDHGLLVRGADPDDKGRFRKNPFLTLLDLETGRPLWPEEFRELDNTTGYVLRGDTAVLVGDDKLVAIHVPSGRSRVVRDVEFQGGEHAGRLYMDKAGFEIISAHNLLSLDSSGGLRYQRYYAKPGKSLGEILTRTVLPILLQAATNAATNTYGTESPTLPTYRPGATVSGTYYYVYTGESTSSGTEGFSLLKVNVDSAQVLGRIWFDERNPDFLNDGASGSVFAADGDRMMSYRFIDWTSLADVARTDNVTMLDTLLGRGLDPNEGSESGVTALMWAASAGAEETVRRFLALGVDVNATDDDGWTALMYAAAGGRLALARVLVEHGAEVDRAAELAGGWRLTARQLALSEGHDSVATFLADHGADTNAVVDLLMRAWAASEAGQPLEGLALLDSARSGDSTIVPPRQLWLSLCVQGAFWEAAGTMIATCDEAIAGDSTAVAGWHARGIARAVAGDLRGASEDFEAALARHPDVGLENTLRRWLRSLRQGRNPFPPHVIARMRGTRP